jgi:hypothetical protein
MRQKAVGRELRGKPRAGTSFVDAGVDRVSCKSDYDYEKEYDYEVGDGHTRGRSLCSQRRPGGYLYASETLGYIRILACFASLCERFFFRLTFHASVSCPNAQFGAKTSKNQAKTALFPMIPKNIERSYCPSV